MKIAVVFPKNNPFVITSPKPVVLAATPYIKYSKFHENITIISPHAEEEITNYNIIKITCHSKKDYYQKALENIKALNPSIIEVHQDIKLASYLSKKLNHKHVILIKHGEYLINRIRENFFIFRALYAFCYLKNIKEVLCISNYVKNTLQNLYPKMFNKFNTCHNNYGHILEFINSQPNVAKKKQIIFAGKMSKYKGIIEFINASIKFLSQYNDYQVLIIGAVFSEKTYYNSLTNKITETSEFKNLIANNRIKILKKLPNIEVLKHMLESEIAVVPTKSNEPFGLVCLEAHLAKCAVISSGNGGLKEISDAFALYLDEVSKEEIYNKLEILANDATLRESLANNGYTYVKNKFNPYTLSAKLDEKREDLLK